MQYFAENFNPREFNGLTDFTGNGIVTLMCHKRTNKLIIRKTVNSINKELYRQLINIRHENLVQVLGVEESGGYCYIYEEFINGKTLSAIFTEGVVAEATAVDWIRQLCGAVRLLHKQNPIIIHRDIKPSNVMLTPENVIKLIDFDASKEFTPYKRRDTEFIGTPDYAAPEQYGFAQSDRRTDIFAIGILFHELITGYKPTDIAAPYNGRYKHIIQNCIELDPQKRYSNIEALENHLKQYSTTGIIRKIPGFRSGKKWKMFIAVPTYLLSSFIFIVAVGLYISSGENIMEALSFPVFLLTLFVPLFVLATNFLQIRDKLPFIGSPYIKERIAGITIFLFLWLLLNISYLILVVPSN